jgi:hypothetical protein
MDARIGATVSPPVLGIDFTETSDIVLMLVFSARCRKNPPDKGAEAIADKIPVSVDRVRRIPMVAEHLIACFGEILQRIDKGAVEIKYRCQIRH